MPSAARAAAPAPAAPFGVGIDLAERRTFGHLDEAAIRRAADRWLWPGERAWCATQPSFREAVVTVLSCKEAVYKARGGSGGMHELSLTMHGYGASGRAVPDGIHPGRIVASWEVSRGSILAFAVAAPAGSAWHLLERIVREHYSAERVAGPGARSKQLCRIGATPCTTAPGDRSCQPVR